MKLALVSSVLLFTTACAADPPSRETVTIQYLHDKRTDLCFAARYGGVNTSSYVMVAVPCSTNVLAVIAEHQR